MAMSGVRVLVVTVSDTRQSHNDVSGDVLVQKLTAAGFDVKKHPGVKDEIMVIRELVRSSAVTNEADAIILTGGTGIAPRDVTPEALEPIFDKRIDGFGEEFRRRSWSSPASSPWRESGADKALGSRAMLARVTAGIVSGTLVVALPGSPAAAELGASLLIDVLPHAVDVMLGRHAHKK